MASTPHARVFEDFLRDFTVARAECVRQCAGGVAVLSPRFPHAHDHNALLVYEAAPPRDVLQAADRRLGQLKHRRIEVFGADLADVYGAAFAAAGYARDDEIVMAATDPPDADRRRGPVAELDIRRRVAAAIASWRLSDPGWAAEVIDQLGERITSALSAADCTFLAVFDEAGEVAARADMFVRGPVTQVEEVMTHPAHEGRGYATRLVLDALDRAPDRSQTFLVAAATDWPRQLYQRLGFAVVGSRAVFGR